MLKNVKLNSLSIAGIILLVALLVMVRIFQARLFYDPLLEFFRSERKVLPEYDSIRLFTGLALRYFMNSAISIGIIWLLFKDKAIIKLCGILYLAFFAVLITAFFMVAGTENPNQMFLFYIRRFLIQPLFLILFVPAFYYQKKMA